MTSKKNFLIILGILVLVLGLAAGCSGGVENGANDSANDSAGDSGKVTLGYVEWDSEIASTHVVKNVLEDMGYEVEMVAVDAGIMWQGIGQGDFDGIVAAWLPGTHGHYLEEVRDKVENLGANLEGAKIGLVVPEYVTIDSIAELNEVADQFDGQIIGIEPGAGIMSATEKALEVYNLDNMELVDSSSAAMAASLKSAVEREEWVVVTGWTPHWKFAKWDLKYLDDPEGVYGGEEHIATIVRPGLKEEKPDVYALLDNFLWEASDMEEVMLRIQDGLTPDEAAQEWIDNNRDQVNAWMP